MVDLLRPGHAATDHRQGSTHARGLSRRATQYREGRASRRPLHARPPRLRARTSAIRSARRVALTCEPALAMGGGAEPKGGWWQDEKGRWRQGSRPDTPLLSDVAAPPAVPPSHTSFTSRFGINPFSLVAFVYGAINFSGVLHLSDNQVLLASAPGTAVGALGLRWVIKKRQRQWFAWTAFGLNAFVSLIGLIVLLIYLVGLIPAVPY